MTLDLVVDGLVIYGPMGIMLGWFMFRTEKVINNNTRAIQDVKVVLENCKKK